MDNVPKSTKPVRTYTQEELRKIYQIFKENPDADQQRKYYLPLVSPQKKTKKTKKTK
jgi:hypothetical protein